MRDHLVCIGSALLSGALGGYLTARLRSWLASRRLWKQVVALEAQQLREQQLREREGGISG
jgi:hypothetical protein